MKEEDLKKIVEKGLIGLANAGSLDGGNWFVGHFGAEVLSLAFLLLNKQVEPDAEGLVFKRIDEIFTVQAKFFDTPINSSTATKTKSIGASPELNDLESKVQACSSQLYIDGHHTIYGALALKAFNLYPELVKPALIQGLTSLLTVCESAGFDRYYKLPSKALTDKKLIEKYTFTSPLCAAESALEQHHTIYPDGEADGQFYFFSGSRLHLITHAQAILDLQNLGYDDIASNALKAYTQHCICINESKSPTDVQPIKAEAKLDPRKTSFWLRAKSNPHHGKLAYAVLDIFTASPKCQQQLALNDLSTYWSVYD